MALAALILASGSPRRAGILRSRGLEVLVVPPALDDADVPADPRDPCAHVMSLAWFKARLVLSGLPPMDSPAGRAMPRWLVSADTMCVHDGRVLGKPANAAQVRSMLRSFEGREHTVVTGICVVDRTTGARRLFFDSAEVHMGELDPAQVDGYIESDEWRGKAGGYNYQERVDAGWPVRCDGDPETVMGLPSRLVLPAVGLEPHGEGAS